jgi:hypothetical protein
MTGKIYVSQETLHKIFLIICTLQIKSYLEPVRKIQVKKALGKKTIIGDPFTSKSYSKPPSEYALDKLMTRAFHKLVNAGKIKQYPRNTGQYWLPRCLKDYKEHEKRKENFQLQLKLKDEEITKKDKEIAKKDADLTFAKTFLHAIKFCRTDEDWELLFTFYRKMRDNEKAHNENMKKYLKEEWEEEQKFRDELSKELDKKNSVP